jgi:RNA polymerase sigma-70 factor (ECF subfamily)
MGRNGDELAKLVAQAQTGNLEAFEALYRRHQPGIFVFIRSQVRETELASDLTQQTFVRAWESLPRLRKVGAFVGWLHRIAANLVRDEVKSGRARLEVAASSLSEADSVVGPADSPAGRPDEMVISAELRQAVRSALGSLPAEQQAVVSCTTWKGCQWRR